MRLVSYNVEWFYRLFDDAGDLLEDDEWSARYKVTRAQQLRALGLIFKAMDADGIMIIEAPDAHAKRDGVRALEQFARRFGLRTRKAVLGFVNETKQEIAFLYDPDKISARHDPRASKTAPQFNKSFTSGMEGLEGVQGRWSKPPLELAVSVEGREIRLIGVHAKSKSTYGAEGEAAIAQLARENRLKQLTQAEWLRLRIDEHIRKGEDLIVMGDFNDGPGLDQYERELGLSMVELVLGAEPGGRGALFDPNIEMALAQRFGAFPTTARFYIPQFERYMQALLDYIMVSKSLTGNAADPVWRIWHPFDDPSCWDNEALRTALLTASDHFPVSLDINLP